MAICLADRQHLRRHDHQVDPARVGVTGARAICACKRTVDPARVGVTLRRLHTLRVPLSHAARDHVHVTRYVGTGAELRMSPTDALSD